MESKLCFITGGERSGKSSFGQKLALEANQEPIYLATAKIWDDDFQERVQRHISDRDSRWTTIEEEIAISKLKLENHVVLLDCVTLWLTNIFMQEQQNLDKSLAIAKMEFDAFCFQKMHLIVVSNEIGMGLHGATELSRKFTQLQGWVNQHIAAKSDEAYFMVSGIPMKIK